MTNPIPPPARIAPEAEASVNAQIQKQEKALDEALELTFPASDPIAVSPGVQNYTPASVR